LERAWLSIIRRVFAGAERQAADAAQMVAERFSLVPTVIAGVSANDRSTTGRLLRTEFKIVADAVLTLPLQSMRGWGRQMTSGFRSSVPLTVVLAGLVGEADEALLSHEDVGVLLVCRFKGVSISGIEGRPGGGGGQAFFAATCTCCQLAFYRQLDPVPQSLWTTAWLEPVMAFIDANPPPVGDVYKPRQVAERN